jgi:hypothetical protein
MQITNLTLRSQQNARTIEMKLKYVLLCPEQHELDSYDYINN